MIVAKPVKALPIRIPSSTKETSPVSLCLRREQKKYIRTVRDYRTRIVLQNTQLAVQSAQHAKHDRLADKEGGEVEHTAHQYANRGPREGRQSTSVSAPRHTHWHTHWSPAHRWSHWPPSHRWSLSHWHLSTAKSWGRLHYFQALFFLQRKC